MSGRYPHRPLVYACSGCSNGAQLANQLALRLEQEGVAEMSCIAGVGGGVPSLVKLAQSERPILALDGCHLGCVNACLRQQGVTPDVHYVFTDDGLRKRYGERHNPDDVERQLPEVRRLAQELMTEPAKR